MNQVESNIIDNAIKLSNMIRLMGFIDHDKAEEMYQKERPALDAVMALSLKRLEEGHIILGCLLQLSLMPGDQRANLANEIAYLLKASCWSAEERIKCALAWAKYCIESRDISEEELALVVNLWTTTDSAIAYGMLCLNKFIIQECVEVKIP